MKIILTALFFFLNLNSFAQNQDQSLNVNPTEPQLAKRLLKQAWEELDRSQKNIALRRDPERSACHFLGRIFALYKMKPETFVKVEVFQYDSKGNPLPSLFREVEIPHFYNSNIEAMTICHPNVWPATADRKNAMIVIEKEINRLNQEFKL